MLQAGDEFVHVIGNEIINASHTVASPGGGMWSLLNASMFDRTKAWSIVLLILGILLLAKSVILEVRQMRGKRSPARSSGS